MNALTIHHSCPGPDEEQTKAILEEFDIRLRPDGKIWGDWSYGWVFETKSARHKCRTLAEVWHYFDQYTRMGCVNTKLYLDAIDGYRDGDDAERQAILEWVEKGARIEDPIAENWIREVLDSTKFAPWDERRLDFMRKYKGHRLFSEFDFTEKPLKEALEILDIERSRSSLSKAIPGADKEACRERL